MWEIPVVFSVFKVLCSKIIKLNYVYCYAYLCADITYPTYGFQFLKL